MKGINCSKLLLRGKKKKVLSRVHVRSLEQKGKNAHDQNEEFIFSGFWQIFRHNRIVQSIMRISLTMLATQESEQITVVTQISTLDVEEKQALVHFVIKFGEDRKDN